MKKMIASLLLAISAIATVSTAAMAERHYLVFGGTDDCSMYFTLEGSTLSLNTDYLRKYDYPYYSYHSLKLFSGWAVCGTISNSILMPDQYAQFVQTETPGCGYIDWSDDTPDGYTTTLLLGHHFQGDGAQAWCGSDGRAVEGTMIAVHEGGIQGITTITAPSIEFNISYHSVPEPSSLLALVCGLGGFCGFIYRRKNHCHSID